MKEQVILITTQEDLVKALTAALTKAGQQVYQSEWLTLQETSKMLGVCTAKINQWRYNRQITYTQTSERVYLYERACVEKILEQNKIEALELPKTY